MTPDDIGRVIAFVTLAFGIGLLAVTALASLVTAPRISQLLGVDVGWVRGVAIVIIAGLSILVIIGRDGREITIAKVKLRLPDTRTSSQQFLITALDIAASASMRQPSGRAYSATCRPGLASSRRSSWRLSAVRSISTRCSAAWCFTG
jgi:phosphatidylglycerol lysyltransferase